MVFQEEKPTIEQVKKFFFDVGASTKGTRKDGLVNAISFGLFRDIVPGVMNRADICLLYTSPSPRDRQKSRMPSSA